MVTPENGSLPQGNMSGRLPIQSTRMLFELWQVYCTFIAQVYCVPMTHWWNFDYFVTKLHVKLHESTLGVVSHLLNTMSPHSVCVNLQKGELPLQNNSFWGSIDKESQGVTDIFQVMSTWGPVCSQELETFGCTGDVHKLLQRVPLYHSSTISVLLASPPLPLQQDCWVLPSCRTWEKATLCCFCSCEGEGAKKLTLFEWIRTWKRFKSWKSVRKEESGITDLNSL